MDKCSCSFPTCAAAPALYWQLLLSHMYSNVALFSVKLLFFISFTAAFAQHTAAVSRHAQLYFPRLTAAAFPQMYQAAYACTPFFMYVQYICTFSTSSVFPHVKLLLLHISTCQKYCCCSPTCTAAFAPQIQLLFHHMSGCWFPTCTAAIFSCFVFLLSLCLLSGVVLSIRFGVKRSEQLLRKCNEYITRSINFIHWQ